MKHNEILEKLLKERQISKKDFASLIGYSQTNYSVVFNKPIYSQKLIDTICEALKIDSSVFMFDEGRSSAESLNVILLSELVDSLREQIKLLKEKIAVLEAKQ